MRDKDICHKKGERRRKTETDKQIDRAINGNERKKEDTYEERQTGGQRQKRDKE